MTEPRQDFPSDPPLSRLYRQFSTDEPSKAVDERILAAAKTALGAAERSPGAGRGRWWRRWRTPLALATTLMLTLTLSLLQQRPPEEGFVPTDPVSQVTPAPAAAPAATLADPARPAAAVAPPSPARAAGAQAEARLPARQPSIGVSERDREAKPESVAERLSTAAAAKSAPPAAAPAATRSERSDVAPAVAGRVTGSSAEAQLEAAPGSVPAAAPAKSRAQGVRTASVWLDEIRALQRQGNLQEAERQLHEFRRVHPDYPLPEDLRP